MRDDVDFELYVMLDYRGKTALRYAGIEEFPETWLDENLGGPIGFGFIRSDDKEISVQMSNPNHAEDTLFESLALLIAGGRKSETIETCINLWMSLQGHWEHTDETIDAYQEIVLVQTFASRNEDYLTAIKNQT